MGYEDWPGWLQTRRDFIRDDILADYVSFDARKDVGQESEQQARLLLLVPGGLAGYTFTYRRLSRKESTCHVVNAWVPLSNLRVVRESDLVVWEGGSAERDSKGTIHLSAALGDWAEIDLPLNPSQDYRADLEASANAASDFLDALQDELVGAARPG